jgi:hypothetical protein
VTDKVVVLDDDPAGTQCVADIDVLLQPDRVGLLQFPGGPDRAVYALTNTRALDAGAAAALMAGIRAICGPDVCPLVVPGNIGTDDTLARVARFLTGRT